MLTEYRFGSVHTTALAVKNPIRFPIIPFLPTIEKVLSFPLLKYLRQPRKNEKLSGQFNVDERAKSPK